MNQKECTEILKRIKTFYPNFEVTQDRAVAWFEVLNKYDFDRAIWNLKKWVTDNKFPPTVSDLIQDQAHARRSESNQTVDQVLANVDKSWEERKKEMDERFAKQGIKIEWNEPDFSKSELPDFLKNRHKRG